jgi:hypothetical protein
MIEAVIFDLDGVLVDSEHVWDEVREELAHERGGRWHDHAQADMMGMSSLEWSRYMHDVIGLAETPAEIDAEVVRRMQTRYADQLPLVEGAVDTVRRVAARAIDSASHRPRTDRSSRRCSTPRASPSSSRQPYRRGGRARKPAPDVCTSEPRAAWTSRPSAAPRSRTPRTASARARASGMQVIAIPNRRIRRQTRALAPQTSYWTGSMSWPARPSLVRRPAWLRSLLEDCGYLQRMRGGRLTGRRLVILIVVLGIAVEIPLVAYFFNRDDGARTAVVTEPQAAPAACRGALPLHPVAGKFEPDDTKLEDCSSRHASSRRTERRVGGSRRRRSRSSSSSTPVAPTRTVIGSCTWSGRRHGAKQDNVARTFAVGSSTCWSGYYHGVLERAFLDVKSATPTVSARVAVALLGPPGPRLLVAHLSVPAVSGTGLMITTAYQLPLSWTSAGG